MSGLPQPHLHKEAKFVFLSDWDGTITQKDSNDYLIDTLGMGPVPRRALNEKVLSGEMGFRDAFREMMDSVDHPFEECKQLLRENISLDSGFLEFYEWCKANAVPLILVSSGMAPIIRAVLESRIGKEEADKVEIIANDVKYTDPEGLGKTWEIVWRHPDSHFGHDKSQSIIPYRSLEQQPVLFFAGDGVSDLSAARHADLLFCKVVQSENTELVKFCEREGIPHVRVGNFKEILKDVKRVVGGSATYQEVLAEVAAIAE